MKRLLVIAASAAALAACNSTSIGPPAPPIGPPPSASDFRAQDFAWSTVPGSGTITGALTYKVGGTRYTCQGGDVVLTPETLWSRHRMTVLYGSPINAAVPVSTVRARTPPAPGEFGSLVRHAKCDASNKFSFSGLPDGGWFVITLAKPAAGDGEPVAVMRRVETRGGVRTVVLN
jgi:hypothetical protein